MSSRGLEGPPAVMHVVSFNEANDHHRKADRAIRRVKCHAVCFVFVAMKKLAGDKAPNDRTIAGALAGAIYWELFAMGAVWTQVSQKKSKEKFILTFDNHHAPLLANSMWSRF